AEFPYARLKEENQQRDKLSPEFELIDTGIFAADRYFDVFVEYAKAEVEDILVRISVANRGPEAAELHLLPTLWFRNTWSWNGAQPSRPSLQRTDAASAVIEAEHQDDRQRWLYCAGAPALLFTENDTNVRRLYGAENGSHYFKDGINDY